ncbi:MAG: lysophospholipid acyltransferase family protein [Vicinamibacterales bacterium]
MEAQPTGLSREALIDAILDFLADQDLLTLQDIRAALEREVDGAGPDALLDLKARLVADNGWDYYPRDPLAQRIHHLLADRFLAYGSEVREAHHLLRVGNAPVVIIANHLSYADADANVIEVLLQRAGGTVLANRLTALAGPKVFTSRERRFSSLCFGTVKVPQSAEVASGEAVLNGREVARAARRSIDIARARLREGDALLLFGEGTRSRPGAMQSMLAGASRYLDVPWHVGAPRGVDRLGSVVSGGSLDAPSGPVVLQVGRPLLAGVLVDRANGDRHLVMDAIGLAVAEALPVEYRGVYRDTAGFPDAKSVLHDSRDPA